MATLYNKDLAKIVAKKHKLPQGAVENFITEMFSLVHEGLEKDKLVKIKGLGAFKITTVKARESVNVNTGERVVIESHDKVSFTPDTSMRDLVNRPFSEFQTVPVNENVDFSSIDGSEVEKTTATDKLIVEPVTENATEEITVVESSKEETVKEDPINEESPISEEDLTNEENPTNEKNTVAKEYPIEEDSPVKKENVIENEVSAVQESSANEKLALTDAYVDEPKSKKTNNALLLSLLALVCLAIGFVAGRLSSGQASPEKNEAKVVASDTASANIKDTAETVKPEVDTTPQNNIDLEKINQDPRLRYGAYRIIGVDSTVTLRKGQTMKRFCDRTLGSGMIIYFQVLNGKDEMGEGEQMKVPRVQVKKSK